MQSFHSIYVTIILRALPMLLVSLIGIVLATTIPQKARKAKMLCLCGSLSILLGVGVGVFLNISRFMNLGQSGHATTPVYLFQLILEYGPQLAIAAGVAAIIASTLSDRRMRDSNPLP